MNQLHELFGMLATLGVVAFGVSLVLKGVFQKRANGLLRGSGFFTAGMVVLYLVTG